MSLLRNVRPLAFRLGEEGEFRREGSGGCCVLLSIILTGFIAQPNVSDRGREPRNTVGAGSGGRGEPWVRYLTNLRACLLFGGGLARERNLPCGNRILSLLRNVRLLALSLREERELCWRRSGECCVLLSIIMRELGAQSNVSGRGREPRNTVGAWSGGRVEPRVRCFSNLPICLPHSGVMSCGRNLPYVSRILPLLWDGDILAIRQGEERELCWRRSGECCVLLSIIMRELGAQSNVSGRGREPRNTVGAWSGGRVEPRVRCFSNLPICLPHSGVMACGRELPYMSRILPLLWDGGILAIRLGEERELCWRWSGERCVLLSIIMTGFSAQSNVSDRRCESRNTVGAWSGRGGEAQVLCFIPLRT